MTRYRPCIDLHRGKVKQIVGSSLTGPNGPTTHFTSDHRAEWYAEKYRQDGLQGGHMIQLGPGNREEALAALRAYPKGLQVGGGMDLDNFRDFLEAGASHIIVTSWLFPENSLDWKRLESLSQAVGRHQLTIDLSCIKKGRIWRVAKNGWKTVTDEILSKELLGELQHYCSELLVHAVEVEGKSSGMDQDLIRHLSEYTSLPTTYAGGARSIEDLELVHQLSEGKIDLTIGSALDLFGGQGVRYTDCLEFNRRMATIG